MPGKVFSTNEVQIAQNQIATIKTYYDEEHFNTSTAGHCSVIQVVKNASLFQVEHTAFIDGNYNSGVVIAGPALIRLRTFTSNPDRGAMVTLDVQPSQYPPDKSVVIGAYSGNVQVTMQVSTDLVNWSTADNGSTYTNSPDARFFRILVDKNAPLPPSTRR